MGLFPTGDLKHEAIYAEESAMVDASELIAEALEASGLSKAELARKLNVSRSEITERLRGDRNITVRVLAATLHALGARLELGVDLPKARVVHQSGDPNVYEKWSTPTASDPHVSVSPLVVGAYEIAGRR